MLAWRWPHALPLPIGCWSDWSHTSPMRAPCRPHAGPMLALWWPSFLNAGLMLAWCWLGACRMLARCWPPSLTDHAGFVIQSSHKPQLLLFQYNPNTSDCYKVLWCVEQKQIIYIIRWLISMQWIIICSDALYQLPYLDRCHCILVWQRLIHASYLRLLHDGTIQQDLAPDASLENGWWQTKHPIMKPNFLL